jgi:hypothetical protein
MARDRDRVRDAPQTAWSKLRRFHIGDSALFRDSDVASDTDRRSIYRPGARFLQTSSLIFEAQCSAYGAVSIDNERREILRDDEVLTHLDLSSGPVARVFLTS